VPNKKIYIKISVIFVEGQVTEVCPSAGTYEYHEEPIVRIRGKSYRDGTEVEYLYEDIKAAKLLITQLMSLMSWSAQLMQK
jgi:hypothetical protein